MKLNKRRSLWLLCQFSLFIDFILFSVWFCHFLRSFAGLCAEGQQRLLGSSTSGGMGRPRLLTSDYESSDSPSSSEHGEHVVQRSSTSSSDRRRDVAPDDVDHDASPSPFPSPSFHVEFTRDDQVHQFSQVRFGDDILHHASQFGKKKFLLLRGMYPVF